MKRRDFLKLTSGLAAYSLLGAPCFGKETPEKPNIILFVVDDMGWTGGSTFGSEFYETPNISRLTSEGMKFTDAYASAPLCSATRASILTGKSTARLHLTATCPYPEVHVAPKWPESNSAHRELIVPPQVSELPLEEVTFSEIMKDSGYKTIFIGKWHLGSQPYYPEAQGFDVNIAGYEQGWPSSYFSPYGNPKLKDGPEGEYLTDRLTNEALSQIEQNKKDPFVMCLWHYAVHGPWQAKKDVEDKYKAKVNPHYKHNNAAYAAMLESMDDSLGKVLDKVRQCGIEDNTIIIFTSDNGAIPSKNGLSLTSNAPLTGGKCMLTEGGIRVPMVVKWPGKIKPGSVCDTPVISYDFMPTMLEAAGIQKPADIEIDGESLLPLLKQEGNLKRQSIYFHFPHYAPIARHLAYSPMGHPRAAIRKGDYKLIHYFTSNRPDELYYLKGDISESENLADILPVRSRELREELLSYLKRSGAWMPRKNPNFGK